MSTIQAANISDGTDTVETTYVVNGSAKTLVNFDGTAPAITSSVNISSLTDHSIGNFSVFFTNSFGAVDWTVSSAAARANSREDQAQSVADMATGSTRTFWGWANDVKWDNDYSCLQFWGDLA